MSNLSFSDLVAQVAKSQGHDPEKLNAEKEKLTTEVEKLEARLASAKSGLAITLAKLQEPIRQATRAANLMGIEIPEEYRTGSAKANGQRSNGGPYRWEPGPLPSSPPGTQLAPREADVSRAMWAWSKGSGGSAGKDGEGVLTVEEFWALVREQTGATELKAGQSIEVVLPNGRPVKVTKTE